MNWVIKSKTGRIMAVCCVVLIVLLQIAFAVPSNAAGKAGEELEVRVQYEGEPGGRIRTKAVFTDNELKAIGARNQMFTNITRIGTVMRTASLGVELEKVIAAAGIDLSSVKSFTFRTTDGYTLTFHGSDYLGATGWYYPNLSRLSYRVDSDDGDGALQMEAGALDGAEQRNGAVLSLKSYSSKAASRPVTYEKMTKDNSYRFLTGQTNLSYLRYEDEDGNEAFHPTTEYDITAWDSVKYIYGIDVVLKGAPPLNGIALNDPDSDLQVGSQHQLQVTFDGDSWGIYDMSDVTWTSSNESVATVDENGLVTVKRAGQATITASAAGHTASVTIGSPAPDEDGEGMVVGEVEAGEDVVPGEENTVDGGANDASPPGNDETANNASENNETANDAPANNETANDDKESSSENKTEEKADGKTPDSRNDKENANSEKDNSSDSIKNNKNSKINTAKVEPDKPEKSKAETKKVLMAREISIGKEVVPEPVKRETGPVSVKADTQALEAVGEYDPKVVGGSAAAAVLACGGGAVFRIRRFRADMGTSIKHKD